MAWPSILTTYTDPLSTDRLNAPSHSGIERAQNDGIESLQNFLGVDGAASTLGTLIYNVRSPGSDGGGHVQSAAKGGTGQTTYTKGDLLAGQSAAVLSKLSIGTDGAVLKANSSMATGIQWGSVPGNPTVRVYSSASTLAWVKPSVLSYIVVEVQAAGGGGGGASTGTDQAAGGGGAGGYSRKVYLASVLGLAETVVIGGAGAGGVGDTNGDAGGNSSFSTSANSILGVGGGGGTKATTSPGAGGGGGGGASGGDINIAGQPGGAGWVISAAADTSGAGGDSQLGSGAITAFTTGGTGISGTAGSGFGSGGSGAAKDSDGGALNGGAGKVGIVVITEV